ncbi:DUF4272 domain-containing protein [Haloferula sp. BvORR071]|uniref:DUF4272 domain-containing protein n=1 Tax=Haloferula sp. BvORR071 TaxID=1396141 RepID=UPI002240ED04|nr:DUF4272 domain-containing protein [Haloferula sp. BvORR071]
MIDREQVKADNNALLHSWGFPVNEALPLLEEESELNPRGAADVARRCMVLGYVVGIGFGADTADLKAALEEWGLWPYTSGRERELLSRIKHSKQERIDITWLEECLQSFAWCLGLDELPRLHCCGEELASKFPEPYTDPADFIAAAKLRPFEEIYREADFHYRLHWATRDARLKNEEFPVSEGLIRERRKALDWALGVEADWDEVPADT